MPFGRSLAASRTRKLLVEVGETLETHITKAAAERFPKRVRAAIHEVPFPASWTRALTSGQTKLQRCRRGLPRHANRSPAPESEVVTRSIWTSAFRAYLPPRGPLPPLRRSGSTRSSRPPSTC